MKTSRIIGIVAASTLAAAAVTGAAVATAATQSAKNSTAQNQQDSKSAQKGSPQGPRDQGPGMPGGPRGDHGPGDHGPGGPGDHGPMGDILHGQAVIEQPDGTIVTEQMQEGEVTAVSATSISLKSTDGFTATYVINADTRLERDHADGTAPQVGDVAHVHGTVDGGTVTAEDVDALSPDAAKAMEQQRQQWEKDHPAPTQRG
ncbi:MAG: DUF5666 domain-containing protein [Candidatus Nanopelagicales bacterium]